jgi:hypothetical protein
MLNNKYRSIFISDIHLGSRACQADLLTQFLKVNTCQNLYLVGDIFDLWKLKDSRYWPQSHSNVIRRFLTSSKRGTKIYYILGNHDEYFRTWISDMNIFGNIIVANSFDHYTVNNQRFLVTHGDMFDGIVRHHKWLSHLGDKAHTFVLWLNTGLNNLRRILGKDYWSFSSFLKTNTKQAMAFIINYEYNLIKYARDEAYHGVICGHIHTPTIKIDEDGFVYFNTGDWCETISALVENHDGTWELLVWDTNINDMKVISTWGIK